MPVFLAAGAVVALEFALSTACCWALFVDALATLFFLSTGGLHPASVVAPVAVNPASNNNCLSFDNGLDSSLLFPVKVLVKVSCCKPAFLICE